MSRVGPGGGEGIGGGVLQEAGLAPLWREGEVEAVEGQHEGVAVDVHADGVAAGELALDEGSAAADHLVEDEVAGLGVAEDDVAGDLGGPVAAIAGLMGGPVAALGERPEGSGLKLEVGGLEGLGVLAAQEWDLRLTDCYSAVPSDEQPVVGRANFPHRLDRQSDPILAVKLKRSRSNDLMGCGCNYPERSL